jgi:hypothetical protein
MTPIYSSLFHQMTVNNIKQEQKEEARMTPPSFDVKFHAQTSVINIGA